VITSVQAGPYTVRGVSVGGVYTSIHVPQLDLMFDVGVPLRSAAAVGTLLLSHGHADHIGALGALLGIRGLQAVKQPLRVVMPAEIVDQVGAALAALSALQRWPLAIEAVGLEAGDELALRRDLVVRAVRTFHPVPSLAYQVVRRVQKLKPELAGLPGRDIAARRAAGEVVSDTVDQIELSYATDTLIQALDHAPELTAGRVLILESTFLDGRKPIDAARAGCHIHLDEIIARAPSFEVAHLVLMHVSQLYRPDEVVPLLHARLPPELRARTQALLPDGGWPG